MKLLSTGENREINNNESSLSKVTIKNANNKLFDLPLKELCIKASYNSACSGNYISLDMLKYVLKRGVRYLDFEVFYVESDNVKKILKPVVATSTDPDFITITSENHILLDDVLSSAVANAFSSPCPNQNDPLFINLRIKSNNRDVYKAVAMSIDNTIKDKIYSNPDNVIFTNVAAGDTVNPANPLSSYNTPLSNIIGRVIISIDKTIFPNYINYTECTGQPCYDLKNYINWQCGSWDMNLIIYSFITPQKLIQINNDNRTTNVKTITVVNPDTTFLMNKTSKNPKYSDFILKYGGCQIVPYRFYSNDSELEEYEKFFNIHNSAFVPLSSAISYYMKQYG